ncbi:thylakoid membrane photosystem I accumulation factor [Iningainema tapete]|uniref:Thylakoid membrane photosystem I accumulation factor n=1 Tax=Iningainema tapete BLCC-T55 TaxID=2748662 RepID=A0A8J7C4K6_9CYAN|nr:thylakoid membrane photosystem I accumulation factor [Iningainema tapete]MBD2771644.1 thylakoid membrane photosystem I accumulation factor [Iningainema tapete BLCC-T55]
MNSIKLQFLHLQRCLLICLLLLCLLFIDKQPAYASIDDDRYDGSIFVVYAGNGSLIPPRATLAQALSEHKPALLAFYIDDSKDCKKYALIVSRVQEFYGKGVEIIPVSVDTIPTKTTYSPNEPGYYYSGRVPQVVVFNKLGKVVLNKKGQVPFEDIDDKFREEFDLLPRSESVELKRRSYNELNSELTE